RGGRPRKLHVDRSLAVTDWDAPRGARFEASCRPAPQVLDGGPLVRTRVVEWPFFIVETWRGTGAWRVEPVSRMWALTCVGGALTVTWGGGELQVRRGQSVVVPAAAAASGELAIVGHDATIVAVRTP
ncbi:MAG: hypothetical protein GY884_24650, partial [Proteobacteria bacterium]|nr:hypothetical protein [Pseudomonadota bacterium]